MNIVQANQKRAELIAELVMGRVFTREGFYADAEWVNWDPKNGLVGVRDAPAIFSYRMKDVEPCAIQFRDPQLTNVKSLELGKPIKVSSKDPERYGGSVSNPTDVEIKKKVEHTFSETFSEEKGIKAGAEASAKASLSFEGIGGEIAAKVYAEYQEHWGKSKTTTDTVSEEWTFPPHTSVEYEAKREVDNMKRKVKAYADFTYFVRLIAGAKGTPPQNMPPPVFDWLDWPTLYTVMIGEAPVNAPLYDLFMDQPLTKKERKRLDAHNYHNVQFMAEYENVRRQEINIKNQ